MKKGEGSCEFQCPVAAINMPGAEELAFIDFPYEMNTDEEKGVVKFRVGEKNVRKMADFLTPFLK